MQLILHRIYLRRKRGNMKDYKKYTKAEMIDIAKNKGFYFIETSNNDYYEISKDDLADFIIRETERCGHHVEIVVYTPYKENEIVLTTYGWFLNTIKPKLREEIIDRLVSLQTYQIEPKEVKVFDNDIFRQIVFKEIQNVNYEKFFKHYYEDEKEMEA